MQFRTAFRTLAVCLAAAVAGAFATSTEPAAAAQTLGPVVDDIGVVCVPKGAPIVIGGYWVMSGADTSLGLDSKRGAEIAIKDMGGGLLGHPCEAHDHCAGFKPAVFEFVSADPKTFKIGQNPKKIWP